MPARNRHQEAKRAERAAAAAERKKQDAAAAAAFVRDPANVLADALWARAECGGVHEGPCCGEWTCCY